MAEATPPTAATPTPTPEELATKLRDSYARCDDAKGYGLCIVCEDEGQCRAVKDIAAAIRQHSEALRSENERLSERNVQVLHDFYLMTRRAEKAEAAVREAVQAGGIEVHKEMMARQAAEAALAAVKLDWLPQALAAKLEAMDDETMCFDGPATYALIRDAAHVLRAQKLHTDRVDAKLVEQARQIEAQRAEIERLTAKLDACILVKDRAFTAATTAEAALSASLERERGMREALTVAYDLSTWAACINWRARNKDNQGEWLDELKELITRTQQLVEPLIKEQPAAALAKEATDVR